MRIRTDGARGRGPLGLAVVVLLAVAACGGPPEPRVLGNGPEGLLLEVPREAIARVEAKAADTGEGNPASEVTEIWLRGNPQPLRGRILAQSDASLHVLVTTGENAAPTLPAADTAPSGASVPAWATPGSVEGRVVFREEPMPDVGIRLTLLPNQFLGGLFTWGGGEVQLETRTDEGGSFRLPSVPPGAYRISLELPERAGWFHRLRDDPDVVVEKGGTANVAIDLTRGRVIR